LNLKISLIAANFFNSYFSQVENVQLKFVLLLQQHICSSATTSRQPSADPEKPVCGPATADSAGGVSSGTSSSDLVRLLMVPSILRQMVDITKDMLVI
jgi:hypothetical protein